MHPFHSIPFQTKSGNLTGNLDRKISSRPSRRDTFWSRSRARHPTYRRASPRAFNPSELARGPKRRPISPGAPPIPVTRDANRARLSIDSKRRSQPDVATTAEKRGTRTLWRLTRSSTRRRARSEDRRPSITPMVSQDPPSLATRLTAHANPLSRDGLQRLAAHGGRDLGLRSPPRSGTRSRTNRPRSPRTRFCPSSERFLTPNGVQVETADISLACASSPPSLRPRLTGWRSQGGLVLRDQLGELRPRPRPVQHHQSERLRLRASARVLHRRAQREGLHRSPVSQGGRGVPHRRRARLPAGVRLPARCWGRSRTGSARGTAIAASPRPSRTTPRRIRTRWATGPPSLAPSSRPCATETFAPRSRRR